MSARELLHFTAGFFFRGPKAGIEERVDETLALVGLDDKADRPIKGFSGGERQRLGLAPAQVNYPDLLILDEPAAALDPMGRDVLGEPLSLPVWLPIGITAALSVIFVAVALARFERLEF